jgi:hypothetical protein
MTYSASDVTSRPYKGEDNLELEGLKVSAPRGAAIHTATEEARGDELGKYRVALTAALGAPREELSPLAWLCPLNGMERTLRFGGERGARARIEVESEGCAMDDPLEDKIKVVVAE